MPWPLPGSNPMTFSPGSSPFPDIQGQTHPRPFPHRASQRTTGRATRHDWLGSFWFIIGPSGSGGTRGSDWEHPEHPQTALTISACILWSLIPPDTKNPVYRGRLSCRWPCWARTGAAEVLRRTQRLWGINLLRGTAWGTTVPGRKGPGPFPKIHQLLPRILASKHSYPRFVLF